MRKKINGFQQPVLDNTSHCDSDLLGNRDGDTMGKEHADSGVILSSDKSPTIYGIRSLVLMIVDKSSSFIRPVGCGSMSM